MPGSARSRDRSSDAAIPLARLDCAPGTVYIDLSGWSPKYFPPVLIQYANTLLKHKVLFGTDFPMIMPDRWLADFDKAGIRDEVKPGILKANAATVLGLAPRPPQAAR